MPTLAQPLVTDTVAPLQSLMGVGVLMNGGLLILPTFLNRTEAEARSLAKQVVKP